MRKYILIIVILVVFGLMQFIRPVRNLQTNESRYDIFYLADADPVTMRTVQAACYDCHSNRSSYPWYASIAPVSWLIDANIKKAKSELNFSEWILYDKHDRVKLLEAVNNVVSEQQMPPPPYLWMHKEARLTAGDIDLITEWANKLSTELSAQLN